MVSQQLREFVLHVEQRCSALARANQIYRFTFSKPGTHNRVPGFLFIKQNGQMCEQNAQLFRFSLEPINNSGDNYADQ